MKFRLLLLVGAAFAVIAAAPLRVRVCAAIALCVWFGVDLGVELLRQRRARRRPPQPYQDPDPWIDCDAEYFAPFGAGLDAGGLHGVCHERKGHEGPHAASVDVEWAR